MGQRPDDWNTLSLCRDHHAEQHRLGEQSFAETHQIDLRQLADEFAIFSPKAVDIRRIKAERASGA
jgi:hypothetical protein